MVFYLIGASAVAAVPETAQIETAQTAAAQTESQPASASTPASRGTVDPASSQATSAESAGKEAEDFAWGILPNLGFNSDDGFGAGLLGQVSWYEAGITPYKYYLFGQFYFTTNQVQIHFLKFDAVELFGLPLRIWGELGYYVTIANNYCGTGNQVLCDPAVPRALVKKPRLNSEQAQRFVDRYYQVRYMRPYSTVNGRWRLTDAAPKLEIMAGWRGYYHITGAWGDPSPYPGSLYAQEYPTGETGLASVLQLGVMLDQRDNEIAPTRGYWIEGSVRGASGLWGSRWDYLGANLILRGFVPLNRARSVVLAARLILDATVGDMPTHELTVIGGSRIVSGVGGEFSARGLRLERYLGRLKAIQQLELRYTFWTFELFEQGFETMFVPFMDAAAVGYDWGDWRGDPRRLLWGVGGGVRLIWNHDFIFKVDVAVSPFETKTPGIYLNLGQVF